MATPITWNTTAVAERIFTQDCNAALFGDSLSAREKSAVTSQDWYSGRFGWVLHLEPDTWKGMSVPLWDETSRVSLDDDAGYSDPLTYTTWHLASGKYDEKHYNSSNPNVPTWQGDSAKGIMPVPGLQIAGETATGSEQDWLTVGIDIAGMPGDWAEQAMDCRIVYHQHSGSPDNLKFQVRRSDASWLEGDNDWDTSGSEMTSVTSTNSIPASATGDAEMKILQPTTGDYSATRLRLASVNFERSVDGLFVDFAAMNSTVVECFSDEYVGDADEDGYYTDEALEDYITLQSIDTVILYVGRNNLGSWSKSTYKTKLATAVGRFQTAMLAAGVSNPIVLLVGSYADQSAIDLSVFDELNEATHEVAVEYDPTSTEQVAFFSYHAALGYARLSSDYLEDNVHPNLDGSRYLAGLFRTNLRNSLMTLVHQWDFNEIEDPVQDRVGSNDLSVINGPLVLVDGPGGAYSQALDFNGTDQWLQNTDNVVLDNTLDWSLGWWQYATAAEYSGATPLLFTKTNTTNGRIGLITDTRMTLRISGPGTIDYNFTPSVADSWAFVLLCHDSSTRNLYCYINGALAGTNPQSTSAIANFTTFDMLNSNGAFSPGAYSYVRVWDSNEQTNVAAHYADLQESLASSTSVGVGVSVS